MSLQENNVQLREGPLIKIFLSFILLIIPTAALAEEPLLEHPRWALELKGGIFEPSVKDWSTYYGKKDMPVYAISLAYSLLPQIEIGAGIGLMTAKGSGREFYHGNPSGEVDYDLLPLELFGSLRGVITDDQWLIPYIGFGWTRMYYYQKVHGGQEVRGFADGYLARLGLEISLNKLDPSAATGMYRDYGVFRTALFVEAEYTHAVVGSESIDIGGTAYMGGLRFEF